jgi:hypothetical protein
MKRIIGLTFVILLFLEAGLLVVDLATALVDRQYLPELTIKSDGTITFYEQPPPYKESPAPELINRTGNVYTLTADVEGYAVRIDCSNIVFDGAGHTIHASPAFINSGLRLLDVTDVTVKNVEVIGDTYSSIFLVGSNCIIKNVKTDALRVNGQGLNTITESSFKSLALWFGNSLVSKCNISLIFVTDRSASNIFSQNNFFCDNSTDELLIGVLSDNSWDNGSLGNYWSDYLTKYPNASEVGKTGIGNTPYIIDENNVDNHPLMYPYDIENDTIAFPKPEPQPEPEPFPTAPVVTASVASVGVAAAGLLVYFRKRKRQALAAS